MEYRDHLVTAGSALKRWFIATCYDAAAVGAMWAAGLWIIGVPWAPVWAVIGAACQFIPNIGPAISVVPPAVLGAITGGWERMLYVLILYAIIVVIDGLVLQPYLMRRMNRVPIWASIVAPLVLGFFFSFWGVLAAAPILAIVYAFRRPQLTAEAQRRGEGLSH